jgi:hypothetical protein
VKRRISWRQAKAQIGAAVPKEKKKVTNYPTNKLHGAGPFLRSQQLLSYSRIQSTLYGTARFITVNKSPPVVSILSKRNPALYPPHAGGPPFVASVTAYSIYLQLPSTLHLQPEDKAWCGDLAPT